MKTYRVRERTHENLLLNLLHARGVESPEAIEQFLKPDFVRDSHDPMLLPDMPKAVERILFALARGESVAVWSDYDCDGIPGGVLLTEFLRIIGLSVRHYIPHRHKEGYGLNKEGLEELAGQGVGLIITVDLGTTEVENITFAKEKNIDVIVTDHHIVQAELPPAFAVINPKRPDSLYPFDGLCGAGVAWKLVQAILSKGRPEGFAEGREKWLLDLVALGTLSDMVPLVGENRMLAHYGLLVMRRRRRPGLAALLDLLRIRSSNLTEDDIGFMIAPRINAASRMDSPHIAARLLATADLDEARDVALQLNHINDERKGLVASTVKEVHKRLSQTDNGGSVIVMGNPNWRPGILGLVANALVEAHKRPAFLWGREGGTEIKGSCRSDGVVNVVDLMGAAGDIFLGFGGHHASGGFSLDESRVHELPDRLEKAYATLESQGNKDEEVLIDSALNLREVPHAMRDLSELAPFGQGNSKPLFLFEGVSVSSVRNFGKSNDHLEAHLVHTSPESEARVAGVSFFSKPDSFTKPLIVGSRADVVGQIENDWRGKPRIRIVDVL